MALGSFMERARNPVGQGVVGHGVSQSQWACLELQVSRKFLPVEIPTRPRLRSGVSA